MKYSYIFKLRLAYKSKFDVNFQDYFELLCNAKDYFNFKASYYRKKKFITNIAVAKDTITVFLDSEEALVNPSKSIRLFYTLLLKSEFSKFAKDGALFRSFDTVETSKNIDDEQLLYLITMSLFRKGEKDILFLDRIKELVIDYGLE